MKSKKRILGLDVSTSITGATVMEETEILQTFMWDTRNKNKFPSLYEKAEFVKRELTNIYDKWHIDEIFVEQSLQSFRSGFSSAKTLSTLSRYNGMVSWLCYEIFEKAPKMIAASSARKTAGVEIKRGENSKEKVLKFVLDKYPQIVVEYTKHGIPTPGTYDVCDSIIIAAAGSSIVSKITDT